MKTYTFKYALVGVFFGFSFPLLAILIDCHRLGLAWNFESFVLIQKQNPIHLIIDTAPIFLGLFAAVAGMRQDKILLINNSIGLLISSIPVYFIWITPTKFQILAMLGIGALMLCAQACFIQALRRSKTHFAVPYFYSTLIFVAIYDFFIFKIIPDNISFIGASLIIIGGISIYLSEIIKKPNIM